SKAYRIYSHPRRRLFEAMLRGRRKYHRDFWALKNVEFEIQKGATVGIIGLNGSGKSTLLSIVAGIMEPTSGSVETEGRIASLLELGSGFNPEFTGRENAMMNGAILGFSREEMLERMPRIEAFAEIGDFIDQPLKTYSTGMMVRIAFASAIQVDPDILIVDEALSVGDAVFQHRCIRRIREFQERGKTILFVSHDIRAVKSLCSEAIFLHAGEMKAMGDASDVANEYHAHIARLQTRRREDAGMPPPSSGSGRAALFRADPDFEARAGLFRHGDGRARVRNVEILDAGGAPVKAVRFDEEAVLRVHIEFLEEAPSYILGFILRDATGADILAVNTHEERIENPRRGPGDTLVIDFRQRLPLRPGSYSVTLAIASTSDSPEYMDWIDNAMVFELLAPRDAKMIYSTVSLPVEISVHS
ncbi:MAG: ABC transporter ATP-binding protein, partial [Vicinamibacteria bacterium]